MIIRIPGFLLALLLTLNCNAQSPSSVVAKHPAAVPVSLRPAPATTPPISNITAPKEINKKKRKPVRVTVAEKQKPQGASHTK